MPDSPAFEPVFDMSMPLPAPLPDTFTLSTTLRFPANDCAIRFASSRSFCEGAEPFSVIASDVTSTETLLLVSVGSLRNAVWMSFLIWSDDSLPEVAPVVELVCPAGAAAEELLGLLDCDPQLLLEEPLGELVAEEEEVPVVELLLDWLEALPEFCA